MSQHAKYLCVQDHRLLWLKLEVEESTIILFQDLQNF